MPQVLKRFYSSQELSVLSSMHLVERIGKSWMISTVIPVHIRNGMDLTFLKRALSSVQSQSTHPCEVILSVDKCPDYSKFRQEIESEFHALNLIFLLQPNSLGISQNTNQALEYATGDYIHVLHQDDWIVDVDVYEFLSIKTKSSESKFFLMVGRRLDRITNPKFDTTALIGNNRVGGPSGILFPNYLGFYFEENLVLLLDVEFVYRLKRELGSPQIIEKICVEYGVSSGQAQNYVLHGEFIAEVEYIFKKFSIRKHRVLADAIYFSGLDEVYSTLNILLEISGNRFSTPLFRAILFANRILIFSRSTIRRALPKRKSDNIGKPLH